jgi:hypothetical protein
MQQMKKTVELLCNSPENEKKGDILLPICDMEPSKKERAFTNAYFSVN